MTLLIIRASAGMAVIRAWIGPSRMSEGDPERQERFRSGEKYMPGLKSIGVDQVMALLFSPKSGIVNR